MVNHAIFYAKTLQTQLKEGNHDSTICTNENEKVTNLDFSTMKNRDMLNNKWIRLVNPTDKEIESVAKLTGVDERSYQSTFG